MGKQYSTIFLIFILTIWQSFVSKELLVEAEASSSSNDKNTQINNSDQYPIIFFENPDFNFGKIFKGQKIEHIYEFENRGKDTLNIGKVKTSCGCTAAILTNNTIPPGNTGEIRATFNSRSYTGNVTKSISVISNDPERPSLQINDFRRNC